jgi:predicted RNA-binding protein associated with RNAse of E/G family
VNRSIHIHYLRPPEEVRIYRQRLIHDDGRVKVTLARDLPFDPPLRIQDRIALESGSDAVWFTFPGAWHDIGRFHRADGTFTGIYANILTPCVFQPGGDWETTDLFLDLWMPAEGGPAVILDEGELEEALAAGQLDPALAQRAREEIQHLQVRLEAGGWPPPVVGEWTRERALASSYP